MPRKKYLTKAQRKAKNIRYRERCRAKNLLYAKIHREKIKRQRAEVLRRILNARKTAGLIANKIKLVEAQIKILEFVYGQLRENQDLCRRMASLEEINLN